jgi:hypothetical protein
VRSLLKSFGRCISSGASSCDVPWVDPSQLDIVGGIVRGGRFLEVIRIEKLEISRGVRRASGMG